MEEALKEHGRVVVVRFNPWHFASEQLLLRGFFATLADALGRSLSTRKEAIGDALKKYGSVLSIASVSMPGVQIGVGDAATGLGEALSSVELDDLRARVERFLNDAETRVVVLIDDIDRLDRAEIQATFKLVKLSASFDHTSYVLAFDDGMVAASLGEKYGEGGLTAGRRFLEKIIQVPLHLPPADVIELRKLAFDGVDDALSLSGLELTEDQIQAFVRHFVDGLEPQLQTPRQAKLFGNALAFALPLLKGEAHPVDLMLIEGIRIFYPKLYATIRDNPDDFLKAAPDGGRRDQHRQRVSDLINDSLSDFGVVDKDRVRDRLVAVLFPRISNMGYGHEWDSIWAKDQHVCSSEYFQRYFTYSVPPGDVGDAETDQLLASLAAQTPTPTDIDAQLRSFADRRAMPRLITKLRYRESTISPATARSLAMALARNGSVLPREEGMFSIGGTWTQGAILVSQLSKIVGSSAERDQFIGDLLQAACPLPFAAECFRWVRRGKDAEDAEHIVSANGEAAAVRQLANRIRERALNMPTCVEFGRDAPHLLWIWSAGRGKDDVTGHIRQWLDSTEEAVDAFLDVYVGKAWGMESGLSHRADFRREAYNSVIELIDPSFVIEKLRARYGQQLDAPQFHHDRDVPLAARIAHQFCFIHNAVVEQQGQATLPGALAADSSPGSD